MISCKCGKFLTPFAIHNVALSPLCISLHDVIYEWPHVSKKSWLVNHFKTRFISRFALTARLRSSSKAWSSTGLDMTRLLEVLNVSCHPDVESLNAHQDTPATNAKFSKRTRSHQPSNTVHQVWWCFFTFYMRRAQAAHDIKWPVKLSTPTTKGLLNNFFEQMSKFCYMFLIT